MSIKKLPIKYDLVIRRGRDFEFVYRLTDKASGTPVDMTGFTVAAQLRDGSSQSANKLADFIADTSQAPSGRIAISLPAATTLELAVGVGYYDVKVTDNAGKSRDHFYGAVQIVDTVTV